MAVEDLIDLEEAVQAHAEPDLKRALARVAMEVNARVQSGAASSSEYMQAVVRTLRNVSGNEHHGLRINCLIDISHFFYILGQTFTSIEPARDAVEIAEGAGDKRLLRKSLTFLGVMYAD